MTGPNDHSDDFDGSKTGERARPLRIAPVGQDEGRRHGSGRALPPVSATRRPIAVRPVRPSSPSRLADVARRALERLRGRLSKVVADIGQLDASVLADRGDAVAIRRLASEVGDLAATLAHLGDLVDTAAPSRSGMCGGSADIFPGTVLEGVLSEVKSSRDTVLPTIILDADDDGAVAVPPSTLTRILRTLVNNAIDAAGPRGEVVLTSVTYEDAVEIEVADSGQGLSGHARAWLFEPGFSTKSDGEGLALAAAYRLAEGLGGGIDVFNCPDGGTAFILRLPRSLKRQLAA